MAKYQSTLTGPQMDAALAAMPDAEAYAKGTRGGQEVQEGDPTYHNNAKYYAQLAQSAFPETYATGAVRGDIDQSTQTEEWRAQARENLGITNPEWGTITGNISSQTDLAEVVSPLINQWDEQWEVGTYSADTGAKSNEGGRIRSANFIPVKANTSYYAKVPTTYTALRVACYDSNKTYLGRSTGWLAPNQNSAFTTPANTAYITFNVTIASATYNHDISINYPSTYTGYYPSKASRIDMPWADLLWENASPTSMFAGQTISLNLSAYRFVMIQTNAQGNYPTYSGVATHICKIGETINMSANLQPRLSSNAYVGARIAETATNGLIFYDGYNCRLDGLNWSNDNFEMLPLRIYGIR